jgi:hypothetical protein
MSEEHSETTAEVETRMRQHMRMRFKPFVPAVLVPIPKQPQFTVHFFPTLILLASTAGVNWLCKHWLGSRSS